MIETIRNSGLIILEHRANNIHENKQPQHTLPEARQEIDDNLTQLLSHAAFHFNITRTKVGPIKKALGLHAKDEEREVAVLARAEMIGEELGLPRGLGSGMMRLIIDEVVKEHKILLGGQDD